MKRSQDINKAWGKIHHPIYKRRGAVEQDGYQAGKRIKMTWIALKGSDDGSVCPHCGSPANESEMSASVRFDGYDSRRKVSTDPYVEIEHTCSKCKKDWTVICVVKPDVVFATSEVK